MNNLSLHLERSPMWNAVEFYLVERGRPNGMVAVAEPSTMNDIDPKVDYHVPTFRLPDDACQILLNELWNLGYRPEELKFTSETIAAMNAHIHDLRLSHETMLAIVRALKD